MRHRFVEPGQHDHVVEAAHERPAARGIEPFLPGGGQRLDVVDFPVGHVAVHEQIASQADVIAMPKEIRQREIQFRQFRRRIAGGNRGCPSRNETRSRGSARRARGAKRRPFRRCGCGFWFAPSKNRRYRRRARNNPPGPPPRASRPNIYPPSSGWRRDANRKRSSIFLPFLIFFAARSAGVGIAVVGNGGGFAAEVHVFAEIVFAGFGVRQHFGRRCRGR